MSDVQGDADAVRSIRATHEDELPRATDGADDRQVTFSQAESRYELRVGGEFVGRLDVQDDGDTRNFLHTEVDSDRQHEGLGTALIHDAVADAKAGGFQIVPQCPAVASYLEEHPDEA